LLASLDKSPVHSQVSHETLSPVASLAAQLECKMGQNWQTLGGRAPHTHLSSTLVCEDNFEQNTASECDAPDTTHLSYHLPSILFSLFGEALKCILLSMCDFSMLDDGNVARGKGSRAAATAQGAQTRTTFCGHVLEHALGTARVGTRGNAREAASTRGKRRQRARRRRESGKARGRKNKKSRELFRSLSCSCL
jgi:hypothetical protein